MEQQYNKGDRVEFRSQQHNNQKRTGVIQNVQGSGQQCKYTIRDDNDNQNVQCQQSNIERKLDDHNLRLITSNTQDYYYRLPFTTKELPLLTPHDYMEFLPNQVSN
ncbi:uncharacterized protein VTP21DRAFT_11701 [Calcarisporiella thermophila]|uniref:uncharacterized protein n=1 Tax=Calcarisporiella thermophila TaxID=911321 RepID=UPI003744955D